MVILEPRCSGPRALHVIRKLRFRKQIISEATRFAGGIWVIWNRDDITMSDIKIRKQFVHVKVCKKDEQDWFLTTIYACPRDHERKECWDELAEVAGNMQDDWLLVGDFNAISSPSKQKGGAPVITSKCGEFSTWINRSNLLDLGYTGSRFTWRGPKWEGHDRVFKKLDRALCNVNWRIRYQEAMVFTLPRIQSDHHLICI